MHFQKIIHRDIKTENLLLGANNKVEITDFGISQMFDEHIDDPLLNNKNASPLYCPPEMCDSRTNHFKGKAVDIWSLGVSLFCLLHGHAPFEDLDILVLYDKIIKSKAKIDPSLSCEVKELMTMMLEKNPLDRITLDEIKTHVWTTQNGKRPMMSSKENCAIGDTKLDDTKQSKQSPIMTVRIKLCHVFK